MKYPEPEIQAQSIIAFSLEHWHELGIMGLRVGPARPNHAVLSLPLRVINLHALID